MKPLSKDDREMGLMMVVVIPIFYVLTFVGPKGADAIPVFVGNMARGLLPAFCIGFLILGGNFVYKSFHLPSQKRYLLLTGLLHIIVSSVFSVLHFL